MEMKKTHSQPRSMASRPRNPLRPPVSSGRYLSVRSPLAARDSYMLPGVEGAAKVKGWVWVGEEPLPLPLLLEVVVVVWARARRRRVVGAGDIVLRGRRGGLVVVGVGVGRGVGLARLEGDRPALASASLSSRGRTATEELVVVVVVVEGVMAAVARGGAGEGAKPTVRSGKAKI